MRKHFVALSFSVLHFVLSEVAACDLPSAPQVAELVPVQLATALSSVSHFLQRSTAACVVASSFGQAFEPTAGQLKPLELLPVDESSEQPEPAARTNVETITRAAVIKFFLFT